MFLQNLLFFANCPAATWPQLGEMLSWQFLSSTTRGLEANQLDMIAHKLFGTSIPRIEMGSSVHCLVCLQCYITFRSRDVSEVGLANYCFLPHQESSKVTTPAKSHGLSSAR